jgi:hypothetical protein
VEDDDLVGAAVVEPLVQRRCLPGRVEVRAYRVRARENRSGKKVVAVEEAARDGLANAVDVDGRRQGDGGKEGEERSEQGRKERGAEEPDIEPRFGGEDERREREEGTARGGGEGKERGGERGLARRAGRSGERWVLGG